MAPLPDKQLPGFDDVRPLLQQRMESLCRDLAPGGSVSGSYYISRNPRRSDDKRAGSFWVRVKGAAIGAWKDEANGDHGDVFKLVAYITNQPDNLSTLKWCRQWLGLEHGFDRKTLEARRDMVRRQREDEDRNAAAELAEKRKSAKGWWLHAQATIEGTLAETYLASRGIKLSRLASPPRALRFLASANHTDKHGEITEWPCMIAAMTAADGKIIGVHRTFLAADGQGKAPVSPTKKIWPHGWQGSVIRLAKGSSGLTPEQAARANIATPLVIVEGIEDGLSIAQADGSYRIWACGTLGNMAHAPIDHACVSHVIIFADNDQGDGPQRQFGKVLTALRQKRDVRVARAFWGKDANQLLEG